MSEQEVARKIGATLIKNSGRGLFKGDAKWKDFIVDIKEHKSFTLNDNMWSKICSDAFSHGLDWHPMLLAVLPEGQKIACVPFSYLSGLFDIIEEQQDIIERFEYER